MNKLLLATCPTYDDGTAYLAYYSYLILKLADSLSIKNKKFEGENVTSENVSNFIKKKDPKMILINGHGNATSLEGHKEEILFSIKKNLDLLKGRLIYARACSAGLLLGKEIVKGNKGCFIGYNTPFSFWMDDKWSAKPSNDRIASLFLEPSNDIMKSLLKGKSAQKADEKSKESMINNMKKILKMEEQHEPAAVGLLPILWSNFEGQVVRGNKQLSF